MSQTPQLRRSPRIAALSKQIPETPIPPKKNKSTTPRPKTPKSSPKTLGPPRTPERASAGTVNATAPPPPKKEPRLLTVHRSRPAIVPLTMPKGVAKAATPVHRNLSSAIISTFPEHYVDEFTVNNTLTAETQLEHLHLDELPFYDAQVGTPDPLGRRQAPLMKQNAKIWLSVGQTASSWAMNG